MESSDQSAGSVKVSLFLAVESFPACVLMGV
jgi:hypothetical protein